MTRAQLITELAAKITSGGSDTTAEDVRDLLTEFISSMVNLTDDLDANDGYLGIDTNGRVDITKINSATQLGKFLQDDGTWNYTNGVATSAAGALTLDDQAERHLVFSGTTATWTGWTLQGNREYSITNIGSGNLTVNSLGGTNTIIDLATSLTPVNTIIIASATAKRVIDNVQFLIFI